MANFPDIFLNIKGRVDSALRGLKQIRGEAGKTEKGLIDFSKAGQVAAGMLARDLVRGFVSATQEAFSLGAQVGTLTNTFTRLVSMSGITTVSIDSLRDATREMIADVDLLAQANQAMLLGIKPDKFEDLAKAAMVLGPAVGKTAAYALESLTTGIGRQSKLMLDNVGIMIEAEDAYEWYAKQLGVTSSSLTEMQKKMGWQAYATELAISKSRELGDVLSKGTVQQARYAAGWKNLTTRIGEFLTPLAAIQPLLSPVMNMMGVMAGTLLPQLIAKMTASIAVHWAEVVALKAKIAAWITAHAVATLGIGLLAIGAAVTGAMAISRGALGGIPSKQYGGPVEETGPHFLHKGEFVLSEKGRKYLDVLMPSVAASHAPAPRPLNFYGDIHVTVKDHRDFVNKMRRLGHYW